MENLNSKEPPMRDTFKSVLKYIGMTFIFWALLKYSAPIIVVIGQSMEPSYYGGDVVICNALRQSYDQGDVIVFKGVNSYSNENLIKRVAALPGDVVDMDNISGEITVNGEVFVDGSKGSVPQGLTLNFPVTVPDDHLFVLGDNAGNSVDSRCEALGMIPMKNVIGVVMVKLPLSKISPINT